MRGDADIALLADVEPIGIAEVRLPRGAAPPAHVHRRHGEGFYVLAGELTFLFGEREERAGPGTWAFVPAGVAHAVFTSSDEARFLDLHVPSFGFGELDEVAPSEGDAVEPEGVLVRSAASAQTVQVSGNRIAFLAESEETGGALGAIEFTAPQEFTGPPAHVHRGFHDIAFVLEGTPAVQVGDEAETAAPGAFVHAPPGVPHTFSNPSDAPLRILNLYVPGGFERFFLERARPTADPAELTSRYDWERA